jgi:hypothetical protein
LQTIQKERKSAAPDETQVEPEFVSQNAPQTPAEEIAALIQARDEIQECIAAFVEHHPEHLGLTQSAA